MSTPAPEDRPADEPPLDAVSELVLECLDRMESSGSAAIDEVCAQHPGQADALRARIATLLGTGLIEEQLELNVPERLGDFRLGACLGGGGMGVVYAAEQVSLGRQVALKLIRPEQLFFPEARQRFQREVEVVARLAHPGIVPVYTVGEEGGLPYFAMERVEGATFAELLAEVVVARGDDPASLTAEDLVGALQRLVERRAADQGAPRQPLPVVDAAAFGPTWTTACLRLVRQVARALDHAHARGVLHRDLKPSNVMVRPDGRALLFDFGLASASDAARMTSTGSQVGSLPYMSSEQLRGDAVDVRTDVYGLGALLCEVLTLEPPHGVRRGEDLVKAILTGEPAALRSRHPTLSRDTETIVLKALDHDPARRYATAVDFARDLDHVLARRPVEARRAGPVLRTARWVERHPARAVAGVLALLLAVGLPTAVAIQRGASNVRIQEALDRANDERARAEAALDEASVERDRAEQALKDASAQRDRAEANLDRALLALDTFLHEVGQSVLPDVPRMEQARLVLLEQAETLLLDLVPQQADDLQMRVRWGEVQRGLAETLENLDRLPEAAVHYRAQRDLLQQLRAETPDPDAYVEELAGCLNNLSNVYERQGDDGSAHAVISEARDLLLEQPSGTEDLHALCVVQRNLGRLLERMGRTAEARVAYRDAVAASEQRLARAEEAGTRDERVAAAGELASSVSGLAFFTERTDGPAAAWPLHERSLPVLLKLAETRPGSVWHQHEAAMSCMNAGGVLYNLGRLADADEVLTRGLELSERLRDEFPDSPAHVRPLAGVSGTLGLVRAQQGRSDEAGTLLERAFEVSGDVVRRFPEDYDMREVHATACLNLASHYVGKDRRTEACAPAREGRESADLLLEGRPGDARMRWVAAWLRIEEAYGRIAGGERELAEELVGQALTIVPEDPRAHVATAEVFAIGAGLLSGDEAEAQGGRALAHLRRGVELGYDNVDKLESTWELGPLAERPEFVALMEGLRAARP